MKAAHKRYDSKWKVTRIALGDYALLKEISLRAGVSMAEALHKLITRQPEPKPELKPEPGQMPMIPIPVFFKPKSISSDGVTAFKPKSIESNGLKAAYFKPKSISGNGITHIKLKSIREV